MQPVIKPLIKLLARIGVLVRKPQFALDSPTDLQRQVAERIMGWTACELRDGMLFGHPPDSTGKEEDLRSVPDYSRSINVAWYLVKEMKRSGYSCEVQETEVLTVPTAAFAKGKHSAFVNDSDTAAEAICRAALKVIEMERQSAAKKL